jgi:hypothetical protein
MDILHAAADLGTIASALVAVGLWAWASWRWHHSMRDAVTRINGELEEAVRLLHRLTQQAEDARRCLTAAAPPPPSVLGPLDGGPPA